MSYSSRLAGLGSALRLFLPLDEAALPFVDGSAAPQTVTTSGSGVSVANTTTPNAAFARYAKITGPSGAVGVAGTAAGPLDLTSAVTYLMLMRPTAFHSSGTADVLGKSASYWTLRTLSTGALRAQIAAGTLPTGWPATNDTPNNLGVVLNEWQLVAVTWSQKSGEVRSYINGILQSVVNRTGTIPSGTNAVSVAASVTGLNYDVNGVAVVAKELSAAFLRALTSDAGIFPPASDDIANLDHPEASVPSDGGIHGERLLPSDAHVVLGGTTDRVRLDTYAIARRDAAAVFPDASNAATVVPVLAERLRDEQIALYTGRASSVDSAYYNGKPFYPGSYSTFNRTFHGPMLVALAEQHHHVKGFARSRALNFAKIIGDAIVANTGVGGRFWVPPAWATGVAYRIGDRVANGGSYYTCTSAHVSAGAFDSTKFGSAYAVSDFPPDTEFTLADFAEATYLLKDDLEPARLTAWTNACIAAANYLTTMGSGNQGDYYTNGNIELMTALGLYRLWMLTGDDAWKTKYDTQWAGTIDGSTWRSGLGAAAASHGLGLQYPVILTIPSGTSFTLTYKGETTATIAADPTAAAIWTALDGLSTAVMPDLSTGVTGAPTVKGDVHVTRGATATEFLLRLPGAPGSYVPGDLTGTNGCTVTESEPTQPDGSDGLGYLTEQTGYSASFPTERGPAGLDWDYIDEVQLPLALRLRRAAVEQEDATTALAALRLLNLMTNLMRKRVNLTTFVADHAGGSRNSKSSFMFNAAMAYLIWNGHRTAASLGNPALHEQWRIVASQQRTNNAGPTENWVRRIGEDISLWAAAV